MSYSCIPKISFIVLFVCLNVLSAQGFTSLIEKIENLEERLTKLEVGLGSNSHNLRDSIDIQAKIASLESKLNQTDFTKNAIVELTSKVEAIEQKMQALAVDGGEAFTDSDLVAELKSLINELRTSIESSEIDEEEGSLSLSNIEFSGFFDLLYTAPRDDEIENGFAISQMELDVESNYSPYLSITGAFAFDGEAIGVGAAFADLHWMGDESSHPVNSTIFDHSGVVVGQFDVPFGADFERLASPDRPLFSVPLAVEHTVDSWNDLGLIVYGGRAVWESQLYFVNGDQDNMAYGGRLAFFLNQFVRVGGSIASIINSDDKLEASLYGVDLVVEYESIGFTGEYIVKQDSKTTNQIDISGFYGEFKYSLEKTFQKDIYLIGGYSAVEYEDMKLSVVTTRLNSITAGAGINVNENVSIRFEYRVDDGEDVLRQATGFGQFVISF